MSFRERKEYDGVLLQGKTVLVDNGIALSNNFICCTMVKGKTKL
jgi:hypothetical protein